MSVPTTTGAFPTQNPPTTGLSPEMVQMRERLQRLEIEMIHMRDTVNQAGTASTVGTAETNRRLTSQFQRIAILDDDRSETHRFLGVISTHLEKLQSEVDPLLELQQDMERSAQRKARFVELIKWSVPAAVAILALIEKVVPGFVTKIGM